MKAAAWRAVQVVLAIIVVGFAAWYLWRLWSDASRTDFRVQLRVAPLLAASAIVLATYGLLIETWRRVLSAMGNDVAFKPAARVWLVANLGKYVPGKIWQVSAMTVMIGEYGVPMAAAAAAAVVITIAVVTTGLAIVILAAATTLRQIAGGMAGVVAATIGLALCLVAAPVLAAQWNRLAARLGRQQLSVTIPAKSIWVAVIGCAISWVTYGIAFKLFVNGITGGSEGSVQAYVAAYTASYLVGYLVLFAPGGIGAREVTLAAILAPLGIASGAQAVAITVASRLWLTVLELAPSLAALFVRPGRVADQTRGSLIP